MKRIIVISLLSMLMACNSNGKSENEMERDPTETQPVSDAIPDSMRLVNDSVIQPDLTPGNGSQTGRGDSLERRTE